MKINEEINFDKILRNVFQIEKLTERHLRDSKLIPPTTMYRF